MNAHSSDALAGKIEFTLAVINPVLDELSAQLDAQGFPVLDADLETGIVRVDATVDPSDYSVLMAAETAARAVGIDPANVLYAEIIG